MGVPTQKQLHRPILEIVDGAEEDIVSLQQIKESLIERFSLTEGDLLEKVPSGQQTRFENRTYWAVSYLKRAGLSASPLRAHFQITPQGRDFLATHAGDDIEIRQLNELIKARQQQTDPEQKVAVPTTDDVGVLIDSTEADSTTPQIEELYGSWTNLPTSYIARPRLVVSLLEMGYQTVGRSGDEGIDGIINQDPLGLEKVYIQAKRWQNRIGEPEIRNFSGSLEAKGANKGVFITTSTFISTARETARFISAGNKYIRLIDGGECPSDD